MSDQNEIFLALKANADALLRIDDRNREYGDRLIELEQKGALRSTMGGGEDTSNGAQMAAICEKDDSFKMIAAGRIKDARVPLGSLNLKTQLVNATGASQPLVAGDRLPMIVTGANRRLTIRDLIPIGRTTLNTVEYAVEATYTNAAAPQGGGSPGNAEGELKAESSFTFELRTAPVITLAHFAVASKQILSDATLLSSFLQNRLIYGLKIEEEEEILTGTGAAGTLNGLCNQATAFNRGSTNQTLIDTLANAKTQLELSDFTPDAVVLSPADFLTISTAKTTTGEYLFGDPLSATPPSIWGMNVVISNSMTQGKFLMGMFSQAAQLWDREDAAVEFSNSHSDFFQRNLVAIRCEERLALTVLRPSALVYGNTSHSG